MYRRFYLSCTCLLTLALGSSLLASPRNISFSQPAGTVEAYDYVQITAEIAGPDARNPFTDATLRGTFGKAGETGRIEVDGFCDSADGSVFRIRFMPSSAGEYSYSLTYRQGSYEKTQSGTFRASDGHRRGLVRVDPKYPWHFIWEGTGEHYFFNGTTAFWLVGWREDRVINYIIERLHGLKINRIRALIAGATNILWGEPVMPGENFSLFLRPWIAEAPESLDHPGIDFTRFNIPYWQKWERMLQYARGRDVIISAILDISTHKAQPVAYSDDERRYIRYAVARLSAFSNINWDLGDDLDSFRDEKWAHETGTLIESWDPYKHLATSHPVHRKNQDRASDWFGFTSIQDWSRRQHAADAGGTPDSDQDRQDHSADERRIRLRRPLSALGAVSGWRFPGDPAPGGMGHRNGRRLRDRRGELPPRHQHLAGHRRRLDQRTGRRYHGHAQRI